MPKRAGACSFWFVFFTKQEKALNVTSSGGYFLEMGKGI
jgi:hypothetical protein